MTIPYKLGVRMITGIEDPKLAEKEFERFFKAITKKFCKKHGRVPNDIDELLQDSMRIRK